MRTNRSKLAKLVHDALHMPRYSVVRIAIPAAFGVALAVSAGPNIAATAAENNVYQTVSTALASTTAALSGSADDSSGGDI